MNGSQVQVLIAIAEILLKSAAILAVGLGMARLIRPRGPGHSEGVLGMALIASLAVVFFNLVVPGITVLHLPGPAEGLQAPANNPSLPAFVGVAPKPSQSAPLTLLDGSQVPGEGMGPLLQGLVLVWATGAIYVVGRIAWNLHRLALIRRFGATPASSDVADRAAGYAQKLGVLSECQVLVSLTELPETPVTWGLFKPTILLPKGAEEWPPERLDSVLLHELAHVLGKDVRLRLSTELACAIYWFQPLAWKTAAQMRDDREIAADETVLRCDVKPSDYADTLLWMASQIGHAKKNHPYEGVPAMNPSRLETRLRLVLGERGRERGSALMLSLTAAVAVALLVPALAAVHAGQTNAPSNQKEQRSLAQQRMKQVSLATLMYAEDYDQVYPYVQSTESATYVLKPYVKTMDLFKSPTPGGRFSFNLNVGGVLLSDIPKPASTPLWFETLPDKTQPIAVSFVDGHSQLAEPAGTTPPGAISSLDGSEPIMLLDKPAVQKALSLKFPRRENSKPLPFGYAETIKP